MTIDTLPQLVLIISFVVMLAAMAATLKENKPTWLYRLVLWGFVVSALIVAASCTVAAVMAGDRNVETYRNWKTAVLPITGNIGNYYLARCYDKGGVLTGSFVLFVGSVHGELYGENCRTFALLEIDTVGALAGVAHPYRSASIPIAELPSALPAQGVIIVPVSEGVALLPPRSHVAGYLYAGQGDAGLEWTLLKIVRIETRERAQ